MSNDSPVMSGDLLAVVGKVYHERQPWDKPFLKGKPLLVNDTFIRVDDIPSYSIHAPYGGRYAIAVDTTSGLTYLHPGSCQGFVIRPQTNHTDVNMINYPTADLRWRCMTQGEIEEARQDHIFTRAYGRDFVQWYETYAEYKNVPGKTDHGSADPALRLRAFNQALHRKRQEIVTEMAKRGLNWNYDKFLQLTYDDKKMSEMFRKTVPPPPPGSNTGREA